MGNSQDLVDLPPPSWEEGKGRIQVHTVVEEAVTSSGNSLEACWEASRMDLRDMAASQVAVINRAAWREWLQAFLEVDR